MSVVNQSFVQDVDAVLSAQWNVGTNTKADAAAGIATLGYDGDLRFLLTHVALSGQGVLGCSAVEMPEGDNALRVDEVAFPVGAIAHRHTHAGAGWRHLVSGDLRIEAEHDTTVMHAGDSWFEPAGSPVRAVALQTSGITRFVRCMVIPADFVGVTTFQLHDPADASLPRLQMTHRHFDHLVQVDAG
ncbi:cupin domain-containing protein [Octadecabacter sp. 1_MG-2023]|uniref:cupin domain-containing protein n=1 Tax=unclassified Octadecabacter TaxID=196158 RepID=UPI001C08DAB7|nr:MULTISPECIES: cupin domain-containing protein [unclassified Octadecabacter]MBU2994020.1 cupin domain-containing protein [Octadecabacter sp. B2R22]MDO6736037.1 cupin domain-containing protein [Octadecabacter sp. 1_MG-2023]